MRDVSQLFAPRRKYKALKYRCPVCNAPPEEACRSELGGVMRGVHRARDLVYNERQLALLEGRPVF